MTETWWKNSSCSNKQLKNIENQSYMYYMQKPNDDDLASNETGEKYLKLLQLENMKLGNTWRLWKSVSSSHIMTKLLQ